MSTVTIHVGSNLDILPYRLSPNSVDAIVTDPPYELGFMGKSWDASGIAYNVELWKQCLRVLKPGGHLLAFSGSRTYHRMTCAIEDAGFEVRDQIMWVYGSGFPKSLDVSKSIDKKRNDWSDIEKIVRFLEAERQRSGVSRKQVEQHFGTVNIGQAFFTITPGSKPRVPMWEQWLSLKSLLCFDDSMDLEVWRLNGRKGKPGESWEQREVLGHKMGTLGSGESFAILGTERKGDKKKEIAITAPATEAAKRWDGWGTALKPAHEPICVARKPLEGTVADNVMKRGTGAINVDACRVGEAPPGRWPANLIHDGSQEVLELFPGDKESSAARFFYCPKASKKDRDDGCEGMEEKSAGVTNQSGRGYKTKCAKCDGYIARSDGAKPCTCDEPEEVYFTSKSKNNHPTVKPTELMRYLCRLVTPPGGTVLDPFMGSGSTGRGAVLEGFDFIGVELSDEYAAIAKARIDAAISK